MAKRLKAAASLWCDLEEGTPPPRRPPGPIHEPGTGRLLRAWQHGGPSSPHVAHSMVACAGQQTALTRPSSVTPAPERQEGPVGHQEMRRRAELSREPVQEAVHLQSDPQALGTQYARVTAPPPHPAPRGVPHGVLMGGGKDVFLVQLRSEGRGGQPGPLWLLQKGSSSGRTPGGRLCLQVHVDAPWLTLSPLPPQCRGARRQDLCDGGHREQRGAGAGQHGGLRARHQHLDPPPPHALPRVQTRLRRDKEIHSERLTSAGQPRETVDESGEACAPHRISFQQHPQEADKHTRGTRCARHSDPLRRMSCRKSSLPVGDPGLARGTGTHLPGRPRAPRKDLL